MIDCIELIFGHQPHEMRKFHGDDTLWFQYYFHSLHKIV